MHILIGFGIVVALVAFAFGPRPAQALVRVFAYLAGFALTAFVLWLSYIVWDEARSGHVPSAKTEAGWMAARTPSITETRGEYKIDSYKSCWKWVEGSVTTSPVPAACTDPDALSGPPGEEPRCGAACDTSHSGRPRKCLEWTNWLPATAANCKKWADK
jgi:hypothetical protein